MATDPDEVLDEARRSFAPEARRRLVLKKTRLRAVAGRHPWLFSGAIAKETGPEDAAIGDLVDESGRRLGSGFYSRHSQIRLRLLTFGDEELTPELLRDRIVAAVSRRAGLESEGTTAVRLVNSEGDGLSGLVVDRYGELLVVEIASAGLDRARDLVLETLRDLRAPVAIRLHNDLGSRKLERLPTRDELIGEIGGEVEIVENGLQFVVPVDGGQKTGMFLDQRGNRLLVGANASGARVLNLFSYTGGFGVYAAAGGARWVDEVEISAPALAISLRNHELNGSAERASFVRADVFDHLRGLSREGRTYDLVVCDPPAFAKSRKDVESAARGYKDVNLHAMKVVEPGGLLFTFSCSGHVSAELFQQILFGAAVDAGREVAIVRRLGAGEDHPVSIYCPEGEYLKGFMLRVD